MAGSNTGPGWAGSRGEAATSYRGGPASGAGDPAYISVELPFDATIAGVARKEVASLLGDDVGDEVVGSVSLVCSELVTNAYRHGSPPIRLKVEVDSAPVPAVEITVTDGGLSYRPRPEGQEIPDESGRGHLIVDALTAHSSLDIGKSGTRAWCRMPFTTPPVLHDSPALRGPEEARHGS